MRCDRSRELVSALLDGETSSRTDDLRQHLDRCAACRAWATRAESLHRSLRLQPAPEVPDLTAAILRARAIDERRGRRTLPAMSALRGMLCIIAGTQLVLAVPELLTRATDHGHAARHLGGWDVAFALGLLVAGVQPWRARGLLPMAMAVAGVMVLTVGVDTLAGGAPGMAEATHVLELSGLAALWAISRLEDARGHGGDGRWRSRLVAAGRWSWRRPRAHRAGAGRGLAHMSAMSSCAEASPASSSRITSSRARATRDRTVPTGQSQADAVSA
jgi:predicted anti-sigma-YlaC factor YlaD